MEVCMSKMLACHLHDYIELICLHRYTVLLTLNNGQYITGVFHNTGFSDTPIKQEVIYGKLKNGHEIEVILTDIKSIEVLNENAQFSIVHF